MFPQTTPDPLHRCIEAYALGLLDRIHALRLHSPFESSTSEYLAYFSGWHLQPLNLEDLPCYTASNVPDPSHPTTPSGLHSKTLSCSDTLKTLTARALTSTLNTLSRSQTPLQN